MVEPLLGLEKVGFVSSCLRDIFLVERGKINTVVQGTNKIFLGALCSSSCLYSTEDEFGKWRTADKQAGNMKKV